MFRLILAFVSRLIPRRPRAAVADPDIEVPPLSSPQETKLPARPTLQSEAGVSFLVADAAGDESEFEEEDEASGDDDDEAGDGDLIDPFISAAKEPLQPERRSIADQRASARYDALSGEHKIFISTTAGPGSLAEALIRLLEEGRVKAEFVERPGEEPHLLYTPIRDFIE